MIKYKPQGIIDRQRKGVGVSALEKNENKNKTSVYRLSVHISLVICVSLPGKHIFLVISVPVLRGNTFDVTVICVPPNTYP